MSVTSEGAASPQDQQRDLAGKDIIVAGAGIGGLSFALALSKKWPSGSPKPKITIYERDSYEKRVGREGYTLSLRSDDRSGGIQVLDKLGLYEDVRAASVQGGDAGSFHIWDKHWNPVLNIRSKPIGPKNLTALRIRRNALQHTLASAAASDNITIIWATSVTTATKNPDGTLTISLSSNTTATCALLVAADGSNSKLRAQLRPDHTLNFANVVCISGTAKFSSPSLVPQPLDRDWGCLLGGQGTGLFVAPIDSTSALWSLSYYSPEPRPQQQHPLPDADVTTLLAEARALAKPFPPKVTELIQATDPQTLMVFNAMDRPPFTHELGREGAVVWIGDANHAVSPFAGNGANMALMDGWELAECLCRVEGVEGAVAEFERAFVPRTRKTLEMSRWSIDVAHARGVKLWVYRMVLGVVRWFVGKT